MNVYSVSKGLRINIGRSFNVHTLKQDGNKEIHNVRSHYVICEMIIYLMKEHIFDFPRFNKLDTIIKISS